MERSQDGSGDETRTLVLLSIKQVICESSHMWNYMQMRTQSTFVTCLRTYIQIPGISSPQSQLCGSLGICLCCVTLLHNPLPGKSIPSCDLQHFTLALLSLQTLKDNSSQVQCLLLFQDTGSPLVPWGPVPRELSFFRPAWVFQGPLTQAPSGLA